VANEQMRELWTRRAGPAWVANRHIFESVFAPVAAAVLAAAEPLDGRVVLDVGCGAGGLSQRAAERGATAVGVDISPTMVAGAQRLHPAARFEVADAQVDDLRAFSAAGFDVVVSEFGVMFFDDPVAAFANIHRAVAEDGRMAFACWRSLEENQMFTLGTHLLAERMPEPSPPLAAGAPGPAAFADPDHTLATLGAAGWHDVDIAPVDVDLRFGFDGSDGVEERLAVILSGSTGSLATEQLRPALGDDGWQALLDDVRAEVRTSMVDGAVQFPGCIWLVRATSSAR
jgi:SAM-dependent methyltransferase